MLVSSLSTRSKRDMKGCGMLDLKNRYLRVNDNDGGQTGMILL